MCLTACVVEVLMLVVVVAAWAVLLLYLTFVLVDV